MNLHTASNQWASRPSDERFQTLEALRDAAQADRAASVSATVLVGDLRAKVDGGRLMINGKTSAAELTNWSYGQLCTQATAPASYLRTLPADLASQCINVGLDKLTASERREAHKLYFRKTDSGLTVKALTSPAYTRLHDAPIVDRLIAMQASNPALELPMTWEGVRAGAYRGDRDMFVFLTDGGSIVDDPILRRSGDSDPRMFRGLILRNSEVGAASFSLTSFLFRFVCGNHIIWGATDVSTKRRRHVGGASLITDVDAMLYAAGRFLQAQSADDDVRAIDKLGDTKVAADRPAVIKALRAFGLSQADAVRSLDQAEQHELRPLSYWGVAQGITRASQASGHQDDRFAMDAIAGDLLIAGRKLVAA